MREARIKCPCCGASITVREVPPDRFKAVSKAMDQLSKAITDLFRRA